MSSGQPLTTEELWRRVGLQELRRALDALERSKQRFEEGLRTLPPCDACARANLLGQLRVAGGRLGREMLGIAMLAEELEKAARAVERAQAEFTTIQTEPCRCPEGPCICHEA
jgi:hypothetical protein